MPVRKNTSVKHRPDKARWLALGLLGTLALLQPALAESAVKLDSQRLSETVPAGSSLRQAAESNMVLAATMARLAAEASASGSIKVAVKTAVAFAPETLLGDAERLTQRREIAAAAQSLRRTMPETKSFTALEDVPYVILELDQAGLSRLETIPGLVRIAGADAFNWRRDFIETRRAAFAAARKHPPGGGGDEEPPRAAIVNGKVAGPGTHPFQAGIMDKKIKDNLDSWYCGGTLVSPTHVVTAAHCVEAISNPSSQLEVLVGTKRLDGSGRRIGVGRVILHPRYDPEYLDYDAAVLELAEPVTGIAFATLASRQPALKGEPLRVTGWGNQAPMDWDRDYPVDLMQADLPYVPDEPYDSVMCAASPRFICAGGNGISNTCSGDSGGPLTINRGAGYTELVGITSYNAGCEPNTGPAGFTSVANSEINSFIRGVVFAPPRTIALPAVSTTASEGAKTVTLTLQRAVTDSVAQVNFATANGTAIFRPTAYFQSDYWGSSGTVTFWRGQAKAEITITLVDDKVKEGSEFFTVTLSQPSSGWKISGNGIGIVTITDND